MCAPTHGVVVPLLFVAFVVTTTGVLAQVGSPFVRRDDWPFLLPRHAAGAVDPVDKVRQEGRWLSYGWWWLVGQHGTPVTAVVVLFVAYAVFVVGLWRLFAIAGVLPGALLGAALLVSPMWVRLIYWPGTLSPAFIVAAVGVWVLPWAAGRRGGLVSWLVVVTVLAVLTYPPVGGVLVIAAAVHLRRRPWVEVLLMCGTFVAGFAVGVFLSFLLNWMVFGHFGVAIAGWRDLHALRSPHDLLVNGHRYAGQVVRLVAALRWSVVIGEWLLSCPWRTRSCAPSSCVSPLRWPWSLGWSALRPLPPVCGPTCAGRCGPGWRSSHQRACSSSGHRGRDGWDWPAWLRSHCSVRRHGTAASRRIRTPGARTTRSSGLPWRWDAAARS